MKLGILITKHTNEAKTLFKSIATSIRSFGDRHAYLENHFQFLAQKDKCDCFLAIGWYNENHLWAETIFRKLAYDEIISSGKKVIIVDTGYLRNSYSPIKEQRKYTSFGINGYKAFGQFYNENSSPERFLNSGMKIKPWKEDGEDILVIGQNFNGTSVDIDIFAWHIKTVKILRETGRKVIFRPHPRAKTEAAITKFPFEVDYSTSKYVQEDLKTCCAVVGYSSNTLCETLLEGVQTCSEGKAAMTYKLRGSRPEREQFFYDLMYCHWNLEEIKAGLWWKHLRPHI